MNSLIMIKILLGFIPGFIPGFIIFVGLVYLVLKMKDII